jgi:large subunit ribosomal protein L15
MLELHNLSPAPGSRKKRKRIGRGPSSGHGKTSGKGHKGQKARSGYSRRLGFEGGQTPLTRRIPKRGFHHQSRYAYAEVNLDILDRHFEDGAEVTAEVLVRKHLIHPKRGGVKVLGRGDITKKLTLKVSAISASAREKIEKAGGSVELHEVAQSRAVTKRTKGKPRIAKVRSAKPKQAPAQQAPAEEAKPKEGKSKSKESKPKEKKSKE